MEPLRNPKADPGGAKSIFWLLLAVACFQIAYGASSQYPEAGYLITGYALGLIKLADQPSVRRAFYHGLAAGILCAGPQLAFLWTIFNLAAIVLWIVFAFWIGLFTAIICGCIRRWGKARALWCIPIVWTGLEYFRSELYWLKFSWLNVGYALPDYPFAPLWCLGMYGAGFLVFAICAPLSGMLPLKRPVLGCLAACLMVVIVTAILREYISAARCERSRPSLSIAGVQMEFPPAGILPAALNQAWKKNPEAQIFVLSEYTLDGAVPDALKHWCRDHSRYLVVGGKEFVTNDIYYNTAFVVGTNGEVLFTQAKSVPIQFFHDGLPAPRQSVWNSPWGKLGICICYDLSYTRVTDELIRQGAQMLIVPTMDVEEWGKHEHVLHTRVAPVRAAEYGVPIFRLASSGISQAVSGQGTTCAQTRLGGNGDVLAVEFRLPYAGSLPPDRWLAPVCTVLTGVLTTTLLLLARQKQQRATNQASKKPQLRGE
jgi:apolipoprotein N-acyltransferase